MSEKLEELISLLYQDRLTQCGKRLLVENIEKLQKENEELKLDLHEMTISNEHKKKEWVHKAILNSYIPKQKIKDRIEELKLLDFGTNLVSQSTANLTTICILQRLLESGENCGE